ncbi:MAG: OsmC family protein [Brachybacterium sp.]
MTASGPAHRSDGEPLYVASVRNTGGTAGRVVLDEGPAGHPELPTGAPRANGEGFNPEQFLAMAWSTCFGETLRVVLRERSAARGADGSAEPMIPEPEVTASVALRRDPAGGYLFVPGLAVRIPGIAESEASTAVAEAHARCPVSRLLRAPGEPEVMLVTGDRSAPTR